MSEIPQTPTVVANPFGNAPVIASPVSGFTSVEQQRAIAEVQAHMILSRSMPRDPRRAMDLIIMDCQIKGLAEEAMYQYARGGTDITGPSIKLAEAVARRWGNIRSGIEEMSRGATGSECKAYAWDLETGYYDERRFYVRHWRDTRQGGYQLTDERDIYELIANVGQRRKRAVLLAIIPSHVIDAAVNQCELTLKATADTSAEGLKKIIAAFAKFGVTQQQIEARIQRRMDAITPAQVVGLQRIYVSLRDAMSSAEDWFEPVQAQGAGAAPQKPAGAEETGQAKSEPAPASTKTTSKSQRMREKVAKQREPAAADATPAQPAEAPPPVPAPAAPAQPQQDLAAPDAKEARYLDYRVAIEGSLGNDERIEAIMESAHESMVQGEITGVHYHRLVRLIDG